MCYNVYLYLLIEIKMWRKNIGWFFSFYNYVNTN